MREMRAKWGLNEGSMRAQWGPKGGPRGLPASEHFLWWDTSHKPDCLSFYLPLEPGPKERQTGLSAVFEVPDKISHRKCVFGVHECLLCATVEFEGKSQPRGSDT